MKTIYKAQVSYNPKNEYTYNTGEFVVKELQKQGYKARCIMGISLMKIQSNAPLMVLKDTLSKIWHKECA